VSAVGYAPLVGFGAFVLASLIVGTRLLVTGWRTRELPELAIGTAFLAGGGLGYLLVVMTLVLHVFPPAVSPLALHAGVFLIYFGTAATTCGVWRIFRPGEAWAGALCAVISGVLAVAFALRLVGPADDATSPIHFWPSTIAGTASYVWSAFEALRYHALLRRRVRLGLAEPAMARRFLLWGCASAAAVGIHTSSMANRFLEPATLGAMILGLQSMLGLVAALAIWLAFFPPDWLERRARAQGAHREA
jgi:hypothetical protein